MEGHRPLPHRHCARTEGAAASGIPGRADSASSLAQPYGSRIRHKDRKTASAISTGILQNLQLAESASATQAGNLQHRSARRGCAHVEPHGEHRILHPGPGLRNSAHRNQFRISAMRRALAALGACLVCCGL